MPYRATGNAIDAPVSILLVTSRETKRWVLPKGNIVTGLSPYASAAHEAEEEAGVIGAICPTPVGMYRYRKRRRNGASVMLEVDVFPLAVTTELDEWDEQDQRDRQWFSLAQAAEAVDEPELRILIRHFNASKASTQLASGIKGHVQQLKKGIGSWRWLQALSPKQSNFFALFEAHAETLTAGSDALARLLQGGAGMNDHIRDIVEREHEADYITRDVLQGVRRTMRPPFHRSAIVNLINAMDDAIDQMQHTAGAIELYEVREFDQDMRDMAAIIVEAARVLAEALPLLRNIRTHAERLHELTERLVKMEDQADQIHAAGLKALFKAHGETNTLRFIISREIYSHLEKVVDRFEDVANEIDGLVIDNS